MSDYLLPEITYILIEFDTEYVYIHLDGNNLDELDSFTISGDLSREDYG